MRFKVSNIDDKIWITSRVRMIAERKSKRNQNISYLAVTYYSLFTVVLSIFSDYYKSTYSLVEEINLAASVIVLVSSLVAGGFRFETRATVYRECYLKLQKLLDDDVDPKEKKERYNEVLWDYPNHSDNDYYDLIINHVYWEGKKLTNGEHPLNPTCFMWASYLFRHSFYYTVVLLLFACPALFLARPLL